ncbi:rhodanese-like domain-containing protein [Polyangium aurulentum]|uniref:rhodanese-like domain-containing protein n=1 Tax=Polyangium aurulentum TaxID=2567896 RepID=UPI0010AED5F0|nr:rhodanese-like domain-containing protein [Polyangium aurulentum]UQA57683.1 rhodanese-like domain-containing protein [Polyangium aurulentum]
MKRRYLWMALAAAALAVAPGCKKSGGDSHASENEAFGRLSVDEVEAKMKEAKEGKLAFHVIDNNARQVYQKGHLPGAKWVDHENVQASDLPPDKEATLVFYCANEH